MTMPTTSCRLQLLRFLSMRVCNRFSETATMAMQRERETKLFSKRRGAAMGTQTINDRFWVVH